MSGVKSSTAPTEQGGSLADLFYVQIAGIPLAVDDRLPYFKREVVGIEFQRAAMERIPRSRFGSLPPDHPRSDYPSFGWRTEPEIADIVRENGLAGSTFCERCPL